MVEVARPARGPWLRQKSFRPTRRAASTKQDDHKCRHRNDLKTFRALRSWICLGYILCQLGAERRIADAAGTGCWYHEGFRSLETDATPQSPRNDGSMPSTHVSALWMKPPVSSFCGWVPSSECVSRSDWRSVAWWTHSWTTTWYSKNRLSFIFKIWRLIRDLRYDLGSSSRIRGSLCASAPLFSIMWVIWMIFVSLSLRHRRPFRSAASNLFAGLTRWSRKRKISSRPLSVSHLS